MVYTEEYEVTFEDCALTSKMTLESILKVAENAASKHSDKADDNVFDSSLNDGIAWVLVEWNLNILKTPKYRDKVTVSTWSRQSDNARSVKREFLISDNMGEHCVEILTKFMLIDRKNGLPLRITDEVIGRYKPEDKVVFDESSLNLIKEPACFENEITIPLRRTDIDFNEHVHNLNYLIFAQEALPEDIYKNAEYSFLRIIYRRAMTADDVAAVCRYSREGKEHTVCIYSQKDNALKCIIVFTEK